MEGSRTSVRTHLYRGCAAHCFEHFGQGSGSIMRDGAQQSVALSLQKITKDMLYNARAGKDANQIGAEQQRGVVEQQKGVQRAQ